MTIKRYLVISDLQIPYHHETAVKNVIKLARKEKFDSVLCVGDEIDFQTISRWAEKTPLAYQQTLEFSKHALSLPGVRGLHVTDFRHDDTLDRLMTDLGRTPRSVN